MMLTYVCEHFVGKDGVVAQIWGAVSYIKTRCVALSFNCGISQSSSYALVYCAFPKRGLWYNQIILFLLAPFPRPNLVLGQTQTEKFGCCSNLLWVQESIRGTRFCKTGATWIPWPGGENEGFKQTSRETTPFTQDSTPFYNVRCLHSLGQRGVCHFF